MGTYSAKITKNEIKNLNLLEKIVSRCGLGDPIIEQVYYMVTILNPFYLTIKEGRVLLNAANTKMTCEQKEFFNERKKIFRGNNVREKK